MGSSTKTVALVLCQFVIVAISIWLGFFRLPEQAFGWIRDYEYWLLLLTGVLLLVALYAFLNGVDFTQRLLAGSWRRLLLPGVYICLVTTVLLSSQPQEYKIIMDEPILVSTSLRMHETRESMTTVKGYHMQGDYVHTRGYVDKRPNFYPFLLSMLHDFTGYRPNQGVYLNALISPVFLVCAFYLGHRLWPQIGGYLSVGLLATVPLLAMNMCGSGFELLNTTLMLASYLLAVCYLNRRDDASLNLLILLAVALAHTRYESALYVIPVGVLIIYSWWRAQRVHLTWSILVAPLLLVTIPMRRTVQHAEPDFWQLRDSGAEQAFSLSYLQPNIKAAFDYFFSFRGDQPASIFLSALFVASLLFLLIHVLRGKLRAKSLMNSNEVIAGLAFGCVLWGCFLITLLYFWGMLNQIAATRLALPVILFQAVFCVAVLAQFRGIKKWGAILCGMTAFYFVVFARPMMARTDFLLPAQMQPAVISFDRYLEAHADESNLYVTNLNLLPVTHRASSITLASSIRAQQKLEHLLWLKSFDNILFYNFYPYDPSMLNESFTNMTDQINEFFETELIHETKVGTFGTIRLSRLTGVKYFEERLTEASEGEIQRPFQNLNAENFHRLLP